MRQLVIGAGPAGYLLVMGDPDNPIPVLIQNVDPANTLYVGNDSGLSPGNPLTCAPLGPGQSTTASGFQTVYGIAAPGQTVAVSTYTGMSNFFLPANLSYLGGCAIWVQPNPPNVPATSIPINSLWFNTANGSMLVWKGNTWTTQQFSGQQLITVATILSAQIANQAITTAKLANGAVTAATVANGTLTTAQIAAAAGILGTQIASATIMGGNIAAQTIVAANIAANTITAAQLAANIIYAGIVDGTTINGGTFLAGVAPNPQIQIGSVSNDGIINFLMNNASVIGAIPTLQGAIVGNYGQLLLNGPAHAGALNDFVGIELNSSDGVSSFANMDFIYTPVGGGSAEQMYIDKNGVTVLSSLNLPGPGQTNFAPGTGPWVTGESWHSIPLPSTGGFSGTARVKLLPWNAVWIDVAVRWTSLTGTTYSFGGNFPSAAYYPVTNRQIIIGAGDGPNTDLPSSITVPTSGPLQLFTAPSTGGSGTANWYGCSTIYPNN